MGRREELLKLFEKSLQPQPQTGQKGNGWFDDWQTFERRIQAVSDRVRDEMVARGVSLEGYTLDATQDAGYTYQIWSNALPFTIRFSNYGDMFTLVGAVTLAKEDLVDSILRIGREDGFVYVSCEELEEIPYTGTNEYARQNGGWWYVFFDYE